MPVNAGVNNLYHLRLSGIGASFLWRVCFMRGEYDKARNPVKSFCGLSFVPEEHQDDSSAPGCNPERWPKPDMAGGE